MAHLVNARGSDISRLVVVHQHAEGDVPNVVAGPTASSQHDIMRARILNVRQLRVVGVVTSDADISIDTTTTGAGSTGAFLNRSRTRDFAAACFGPRVLIVTVTRHGCCVERRFE